MAVEELVGRIPHGWTYTTLGKACADGGGDIQTGPFGSQLHAADYVPVGIPLIMPQNIGDNRICESGIARIMPEDAARLSRYLVREGDIVYSRRGDVEKRALIRANEDGWLCGTGCLRVRLGNDGANPRYAAYYLGHPNVREWIVRHAHGATMPNLNTSILSSCPFVIPPPAEQRAIAHILGTLDDKIELNRRRNQTLEAMARALFKDWFVDFGPVRAKMEGRARQDGARSGQPRTPQASDLPWPGAEAGAGAQGEPYLPADLWQLFPDRLDDEGKPEGWNERPLDEIADFLNGLALQKFPATDPDDSLPVIKITELRSGVSAKSDRASREVPPKYVIKDGDFLFSWSGSLLAKFWTEGEGALNQHLFKVTSERYPMWFVSHWVYHHLEEFKAIAASKATTMGHIQRGHLKAAMTICPPDDVLERMGIVMAPLVEQAIQNELESRTLAQLRDTLLPKLISGELRIADTAAFMERVEAVAT